MISETIRENDGIGDIGKTVSDSDALLSLNLPHFRILHQAAYLHPWSQDRCLDLSRQLPTSFFHVPPANLLGLGFNQPQLL
jgi:hypothetical protein